MLLKLEAETECHKSGFLLSLKCFKKDTNKMVPNVHSKTQYDTIRYSMVQ